MTSFRRGQSRLGGDFQEHTFTLSSFCRGLLCTYVTSFYLISLQTGAIETTIPFASGIGDVRVVIRSTVK